MRHASADKEIVVRHDENGAFRQKGIKKSPKHKAWGCICVMRRAKRMTIQKRNHFSFLFEPVDQ